MNALRIRFLFVCGLVACTLCIVQGQTTYYCKGGSVANALANWNTSRDGTGSDLDSFAVNYHTYVIQNGQSVGTSAQWDITGYNAKVLIETGGSLTATHLVHVNNFEVRDGATYIHSAISSQPNGSTEDIPGNFSRAFSPNSNVIIRKWANGGTEPAPLPGSLGNLTLDLDNLGGDWLSAVFYTAPLQGNLVIEQTGGSGRAFILGTALVYGDLTVNGGILDLSNSSVAGTDMVTIGGSFRHNAGTVEVSGTERIVELSIGSGVDTSYFYSVGTSFVNDRINYEARGNSRFVLLSDLSVAASRLFRGTAAIDCGLFAIKGSGSAAFGARILVGSPGGITAIGNLGNIQVSGERNYNSGTAFVYVGSSAQYTGTGLPVNTDTLIINNTNGVTLSDSVCIVKKLRIERGMFYTGSNTVVLGGSASIEGERTGNYLVGNLYTERPAGIGPDQLGGIGVEFDPRSALYTASVLRRSGPTGIAASGGQQGIARTWILTGSQWADVSVSFSWISDDDNGKDLSAMRVWKSTDAGSTWLPVGSVQNASAARQVSVTVSSFSEFTVSDESSSLPVTIASFTALPHNDGVLLCWKTATELNNYCFEVERRRISAPPAAVSGAWQKAGVVSGAGSSSAPREYSFTDSKLAGGRYAYRLKQINNDGTSTYSQSVEAVLGSVPQEHGLLQNYPNPFNPTTAVSYQLSAISQTKLSVCDLLGREVAVLVNEEKPAGSYTVSWDASLCPSGVYFSQLRAGDRVLTRKMLLAK